MHYQQGEVPLPGPGSPLCHPQGTLAAGRWPWIWGLCRSCCCWREKPSGKREQAQAAARDSHLSGKQWITGDRNPLPGCPSLDFSSSKVQLEKDPHSQPGLGSGSSPGMAKSGSSFISPHSSCQIKGSGWSLKGRKALQQPGKGAQGIAGAGIAGDGAHVLSEGEIRCQRGTR